MEVDAPMSGWTQATFPTSFHSWYKVAESVTNIYTGSDAAYSGGGYTINTGRSTLSYLLYGISAPSSWFHPQFICVGY